MLIYYKKMGQLFSNTSVAQSIYQSSVDFTNTINNSHSLPQEEKKEIKINIEDLDDLTKQELINYLISRNYKKLNVYDEKFINTLKNVEVVSETLIPFEMEMYEKLKEHIKEYDYKLDKKNGRYQYKFRRFVKPKFTKSDYDDSIKSAKNQFKVTDKLSFDYKIAAPVEESKYYPITQEEFMASFKDDKSTIDMMGISKLMLAESSDYNKQKLVNIYNANMTSEEAIHKYAVGKSCFIYKGHKTGDVDDLKSFRQITSIPISVNHMHRILALRLNKYLLENKYIDTDIQKGGISGIVNPMFQQILKLKNTIKHAAKQKKECCIMYVDISNAFPSLNIDRVCEVLEKYQVEKTYINYIRTFYKNLEYYAETSDWKSELHAWNGGLLQGCPISPLLFVTTFGYLLKHLENKYLENGAFEYSNGQKIMLMAYIDDVTIIAKDYETMMKMYTEFSNLCKEFGLSINIKKTKYMHINPPPIVVKENALEVKEVKEEKQNEIEKVDNYKYLGEYISTATYSSSYIQFYYQLKSRLEWLDQSKMSKEEKEEMVKLLIPKIQKKFTVLYDIGIQSKKKLVFMIKTYLEKWGVTIEKLEIQLVPDLKSFIEASNDKILKNIEIEDEPYTMEHIDEPVINVKDVVFTYNNENTKKKDEHEEFDEYEESDEEDD